jgi:hypothetical protein
MQTHSSRIPPQTLRQAKAAYKKQHGSRVTSTQARRLERASELERRAERLKQAEIKRKAAQRRKVEKELQEREERKRAGGHGLATQCIGYSHSQAAMRRGMEGFLGLGRRDEPSLSHLEHELEPQLEKADIPEPWDVNSSLEESLCNIEESGLGQREEQNHNSKDGDNSCDAMIQNALDFKSASLETTLTAPSSEAQSLHLRTVLSISQRWGPASPDGTFIEKRDIAGNETHRCCNANQMEPKIPEARQTSTILTEAPPTMNCANPLQSLQAQYHEKPCPITDDLDSLDDFIASSTQIAREISAEVPSTSGTLSSRVKPTALDAAPAVACGIKSLDSKNGLRTSTNAMPPPARSPNSALMCTAEAGNPHQNSTLISRQLEYKASGLPDTNPSTSRQRLPNLCPKSSVVASLSQFALDVQDLEFIFENEIVFTQDCRQDGRSAASRSTTTAVLINEEELSLFAEYFEDDAII